MKLRNNAHTFVRGVTAGYVRLSLVVLVALMFRATGFAQGGPTVGAPVAPYISRTPLDQLPVHSGGPDDSPNLKDGGPGPLVPHGPHGPDPLVKGGPDNAVPGVTPDSFKVANPNFPGIAGGNPPDPNGAVGPNHYIQTSNPGRVYQIFDKQGNSLAGPTSMQQIWIDAGAPSNDDCRTRMRGDPYSAYDHLADRWVLTQFANKTTNTGDPLQIQCIAVSRGPNPVTDGWFVYTFDLGYSNDYPKLSVWPDGYYLVSQRGYTGGAIDVVAFDRATMLNGGAATFQHQTGDPGLTVIMLPSHLEGPPPAPGTPNFYVRPIDGALFGGNDRIEVYEFHTDWGVPANTTFTLAATLTPSAFSSDICAGNNLFNYCIPQPGVPDVLETLSVWPMSPANYRNFGDHESLVFNHSVDTDGNGLVGVRWYELRRNAGVWSIYQEGTFSPPDGQSIHRWMGSIAMDKVGNMALGYSVSNATNVNPGIRYTGRLATDPLGLMPAGEYVLANGTGVFNPTAGTDNIRWGDYSAMRVDPVDGCTFWYTTHYNLAGANATRIGAFRFDTCNPADLKITKSDSPDPVLAGNILQYTINVTNNGSDNATGVVVTDTLPTGLLFLSSSIPCSGAGSVKTCNIGNLANGDTKSFTIEVRVPANFLSILGVASRDITNTASVVSDQLDPNTDDNTATETTTVIERADLRITKVCKPDGPAQAGSTGYCDIIVSNLGVSDARNVSVTDLLTSNAPFTVTGYVTTPPVNCAPVPPVGPNTQITVTCSVGTLAAGASTTIKVSVTTSTGADVNDVATVTSSTPDPDLSNNEAIGSIIFEAVANLSITKVSAPNPVAAGTNLTYTLTVSNAGPSTATNVVATDTLPGQVSVVSVTPSVGSCSGGIPGNPAQPVICTLGSMASAGSATITVVVKVNASTPNGTILVNNGAVSSGTFDPDNANNVVTANSPVVAQADLAITNVPSSPKYKSNKPLTYTIRVTNNGPSDALAVVVTDALPADPAVTYLSDTAGCTLIDNVLTCALGNMPTGTYRQFNVVIKVSGNRGSLDATATVDSLTTDLNAVNDSATATISF